MNIVKYFELDGCKVYDTEGALDDSGWGVKFEDILDMTGIRLKTRFDGSERVVVDRVTYDTLMNMYFVHWIGGGFMCLDHAIDLLELVED